MPFAIILWQTKQGGQVRHICYLLSEKSDGSYAYGKQREIRLGISLQKLIYLARNVSAMYFALVEDSLK